MTRKYRELMQRSSLHGRRETASLAGRFLLVFGFVACTYVYVVVTALYGVSLAAAIGASAMHPGNFFRPIDFAMMAMTAALLVTVSAAWPKIPEVASYFWNQFEDAVGRIVVAVHSMTHTCIPERFWFIRKLCGWVSFFIIILITLTCFHWAIDQVPVLPKNLDVSDALNRIVTLQMFRFAIGIVTALTISSLTLRFSFSSKWRMVFAKPECVEVGIPRENATRKQKGVRILHASDLHITDGPEVPLTEGSQRISDELVTAVMTSLTVDAHDCDAVLVTGDITDNGSGKSWERFLDACPDDLRKQLILVPGNHDLNLQQGQLPTRAERLDSFGRRMRQIRAMCAMAEVMGDRAYVIDRETERCLTLGEYVERQRGALEAHISGDMRARRPMPEVWDEMFPIVAVIEGHRVGVVILDTVKPASINVTNAIGAVPAETIRACNKLMAKMANRCDSFVYAIHHHIAVPYAKSWRSRVQNAFLVFQNAVQFVEMLTRRREPTIVFHGHRHVAYTGRVRDSEICIIASPSATVGSHSKPGEGSWRLVELNVSDGACTLATEPEFRSVTVPMRVKEPATDQNGAFPTTATVT